MTKKRIYVCLSVLLFMAFLICLLTLRFYGSISVKGGQAAIAPDSVFFSQKNPLWAGDTLGNSSFTMESSGCLTACLAAALRMQDIAVPGPAPIDPGSLNALLSREQVYDKEGNIRWETLQSALQVSIERVNGVSAMKGTDLAALISEGIYPIVRVRMNGLGSFHYVLLIQCLDGRFWCMDPLSPDEKPVPLSDFGNRIYAIRYLNNRSDKSERLPFRTSSALNPQLSDPPAFSSPSGYPFSALLRRFPAQW